MNSKTLVLKDRKKIEFGEEERYKVIKMMKNFDFLYFDDDKVRAEKLDDFIAEHNLQEELDDLHSFDEMIEYIRELVNSSDYYDFVKAGSLISEITEDDEICEYYKYNFDESCDPEKINSLEDLFDVYEYELDNLGIQNPEEDNPDDE